MDQPARPVPQRKDRLLTAITATVLVLAAGLTAVAIIHQRSGPLVFEMPSLVSAMAGIAGLGALGVAFLVLGRYRVLRDPPAFWVGLCFAALSILYLLFLLTWPGGLDSDEGVIARLPNTSAWITVLKSAVLGILLLVAALARWPGADSRVSRRWLAWVVAWTVLWLLIGVVTVAREDRLPPLIVGTVYQPMPVLLALPVLMAIGAVVAAYRYVKTGQRLLAYVALAQLCALGGMLARLFGAQRYELWWYLFRLLSMAPILVMLYGMLIEYVGLYHRVRDRSEELQRQQALLEAVLSQMPAGVIIAEAPSGHILMDSPQERQPVSGQPTPRTEEWDQRSAQHGYHPDGRPYLPEEWPLDRALRQGETVHDEEVYLDRNAGARGVVAISAAPVRDPQGHILAAVAIYRDMTQRKRDEEALRESESRLRDVLQNSRDALYRLNLETRTYEYISPAIEALSGYTAEEMLQRGPTMAEEMVHPDDRATYEAYNKAVVQGDAGATGTMEFRWRTKHGTYRWLSIHGQFAHDADGHPVAYIGTLGDITERQEAALEQRRLAEQRQLALDAARMGWWRYDPHTRMVSYDARFGEIFGLFGSECKVTAILHKIHSDRREIVQNSMALALDPARPHPYGGEFDIIQDDGSVRWLVGYGIPILEGEGAERRTTSLVGTVADITERRQAEEALRDANEELRRFNRAMVGREMRMIELKKEINALCLSVGLPPRYSLGPDKEGQ